MIYLLRYTTLMLSKNEISAEKLKSMAKTVFDVFTPSALGVAIYIVVYAITVLANQPSQYKNTWRTVYLNYLHHSFIYHFVGAVNRVIQTQAASTVALYLFWGIIGLAIFALGVRLTNNFNELAEDISLRNYIWPKGADHNSPLKEFIERLVYRIFISIVFFIYLSRALPWLSAQWKGGLAGINLTTISLKHYAVLFIYEFIVLHVAVVILRFLFLRRRLIEY